MKSELLIKNAIQLLTVKSDKTKVKGEMEDLGIINDGAIAVRNNRIFRVDKKIKTDSKKIIDASGKVVMPGFVDCHTHLVFSGSRENELKMKLKGKTYLEILESGGGIHFTVNKTRKADIKELVALGLRRLDEMLLNGTTTVEIKTGYGLNPKDEIKCLKVINELNKRHAADIVPTFLGAHAVPLEFKNNPDEYTDLILNKMLPRIKNLAEFCDVFCEKNVFTIEQARKILNEGKKFGLTPKIHADELYCTGGAELASEIGCVSADHLLRASDKGIKKMAEKGVIGVLLPGTSFTTMEKYADARKYIDYGLPVALASDFNPNCWVNNMGFIIALACYNMKMTPAEAISASTINAAFAIGKEKEIGSLEVGKKADILILNVPNYESIPYKLGMNIVDTVIKNGKVVVENGRIKK
ncbi:MAG: imidazolonepropionase [Euryarchaeota archaeon CG01_land_8_20_14_3_00_38_12]|nr:MAG: imidazolonepropionase [Euryarchaeota archaeon CG01_land_8_20_14_3_00_38_12]PJB22114.1 MAG: imidazolonepropionase [Euryarchaeota archaeon CG_4_9_14_3_um_filter_38_12]